MTAYADPVAQAEVTWLRAELMKSNRAVETLGRILDRSAAEVCELAGVEQGEDGDADFQLAWDLLRARAELTDRLRARVAELAGELDAVDADLRDLREAVVEQDDRCEENPDGFCNWHGYRFDACPFEKAWAVA